MIQEIAPKVLDNQYKNVTPAESDIVFLFTGTGRRNDAALMKVIGEEESFSLPTVDMLPAELRKKLQYLFAIDDLKFYLLIENDEPFSLPDYTYEPVNIFRNNEPGYLCFAGMTAYHLFVWYRDNKFCGRCGAKAEHDDNQRMMRCPECGNMIFPKICPAVIVGLRNGDSILMSRYAGRGPAKRRSLIAGFCEIGERPEETVVREVFEEVGLKATNVTYYGAQPWGIDSDLLLGYFADVEGSTDVILDTNELSSARFVRRESLEPNPNLASLTATMIEEFRTGRW